MEHLDESILLEMTGRLVNEFDPDKVILFGSHAWGQATEFSDIDLYVVVPDSTERPLARLREVTGVRLCIW